MAKWWWAKTEQFPSKAPSFYERETIVASDPIPKDPEPEISEPEPPEPVPVTIWFVGEVGRREPIVLAAVGDIYEICNRDSDFFYFQQPSGSYAYFNKSHFLRVDGPKDP